MSEPRSDRRRGGRHSGYDARVQVTTTNKQTSTQTSRQTNRQTRAGRRSDAVTRLQDSGSPPLVFSSPGYKLRFFYLLGGSTELDGGSGACRLPAGLRLRPGRSVFAPRCHDRGGSSCALCKKPLSVRDAAASREDAERTGPLQLLVKPSASLLEFLSKHLLPVSV